MALNYLGLAINDNGLVGNVNVPAGSTFTFYDPSTLIPLYAINREYRYKVVVVDIYPTEAENFDNLMESIETQLQQEVGDNFNVVDKDWDVYGYLSYLGSEADKLHQPASETEYTISFSLRLFEV